MAWVWSPIALLGLIGAPFFFALGLTLYFAGPKRQRELYLSGLLVAYGIKSITGAGLMYLMTSPADAFALQVIATVTNFAILSLLLLFAGTFPSPLSRPFRTRTGIAVTSMMGVGLTAWALLDSSRITLGVVPASYAPWDGVGSPFSSMWLLFVLPLSTAYLLAVGIDTARRQPPGTDAHRQGRILSRALAVQFAGLLVGYPMLVLGPSDAWTIAALTILIGAGVGMGLILAHGALKASLFDVDLKIKWGVRRGTVAAAFIGAFFVVSEGAETILSARYGPFLGLMAAGALVFAIAPLQRVADGFADRAMPRVEDTAEYRMVRKREVYRAAVEGVLEDGEVTNKERAVLARLADQLGLGPLEMHVEQTRSSWRGRDRARSA